MGSTPIPVIDAAGITKPLFSDCLAYFDDGFKSIYGSDLYWAPDDRDRQFMAMLATALDDTNAAIVADFLSRDPAQAVGVGLSSIVKINGIRRMTPSFSTASVLLTGVAGTTILNGLVQDQNGNMWTLPASVVIPLGGQISATATCSVLGAISAGPGDLSTIGSPTVGWQSVVNPNAASPGAPVEKDALVRLRQSFSTMLPAASVYDGMLGALMAIAGVSNVVIYENDDDVSDPVYGIPAKSIAAVVAGGDGQEIADQLRIRKGDGVATFGNTLMFSAETSGALRRIRFSRPADASISFVVHVTPRAGFTTDIQNQIKTSIAGWINAIGYGGLVELAEAWSFAKLNNGPGSSTFGVSAIYMARSGGIPGVADIATLYNENPKCTAANVQIVLPPT